MPKGQKTKKCTRCRDSHLKCERDSPDQGQCKNCKEKGVEHCFDEFPPIKQRKSNHLSRSPTQQIHHARSYQRHLTRSGSSSHHSDDNDTIAVVPEPNAPDSSPSFNVESDCCGVTFEPEKKLENCREWLRLHEYLRAIAKSPGKLELGSQKKSPGTKARSKVSNNLLGPIYAIFCCEIENSSDGARQDEWFLLQLQLAIAQVRRGTPADESRSLLNLEIAAVNRRAHIVESLGTNATVSKEGIQLTREALKKEELDLTERRQECRSSRLPEQAFSANESGYSTPNSVLPQVNALDPLKDGGSRFADIQHEVAEASRNILAGHCPIRWERIRGGQPPFFFPPPFCDLLCGSDYVAQSYMETAPKLESLYDWSGKTIAHIAAQSGRISLVDSVLLTDNRADFDQRDSFGLTPVMIAAIHAPLECLRLLIKANYRTHERDIYGRSLVSIAARHGRRDVVEYLLDNGTGFPNDPHGVERCSPIYEAIEFGIENQNVSTCVLLLNRGADPYVRVNGKSALALAIEASPDYLGLIFKWWQLSTPAGNNFDEYSTGPFTSPFNQQLARAGASGNSNALHPRSTMTAQAANQTNQAVLQEFPTHGGYGLPQDQQFYLDEQYATWPAYPGAATMSTFQPNFVQH